MTVFRFPVGPAWIFPFFKKATMESLVLRRPKPSLVQSPCGLLIGTSNGFGLSPQCINREARAANFSSSLNLPDKTLQFVKDHPLMDDSVTPIDNRPRLVKSGVNYTQIVVDRTQALDGTVYDVMFISTGGSRAWVITLVNPADLGGWSWAGVFLRSLHTWVASDLCDHQTTWGTGWTCKSWPRSGNSGLVSLGWCQGSQLGADRRHLPPACPGLQWEAQLPAAHGLGNGCFWSGREWPGAAAGGC